MKVLPEQANYKLNQDAEGLKRSLVHFRDKLLPYAYNIIGAIEPAWDVVEEVIVPFFMHDQDHVHNVSGYLVRSVVNKSISYKDKLQNELTGYPGEWLPEPVTTSESIYSQTDKQEILNYSLLVLLEKLNPEERAVFILKHAFDYKHSDIAGILHIREEHCRQLFRRAKNKISFRKGARKKLSMDDTAFLQELVDAMARADLRDIERLLTGPVKAISDGGPHVSAARNILNGKDRVAKLLKAIGTKYHLPDTQISYAVFNHQVAITYRSESGSMYRAIIAEVENRAIERLYIVVNPDKLAQLHLSPNPDQVTPERR